MNCVRSENRRVNVVLLRSTLPLHSAAVMRYTNVLRPELLRTTAWKLFVLGQ